jgi:hypothetical protein
MKKVLFLSYALVILASCTNGQVGKITGNGHITKQTRTPGNFKGVSLSGSMDVILTKGNSFSVVVEGDDNLLQYIETIVKDDVLKIGTNTPKLSWISTKNIVIHVTLPTLDKTIVSGSGTLNSDDEFSSSGTFQASVSGSGSCKIAIKTQKLDARVSGSGNIRISGSADNSIIAISGSGNYRGLDLQTKDASITISGSGNVETSVNGNLDARISGSGGVKYKGNAAVQVKTSGSGRVSRI